jgi:hypothetical protein
MARPARDNLPSTLYADWRRLGIAFSGAATQTTVDLESLILRTAAASPTDERLTVCAASWLARYHDFVDGRRLSELTRSSPSRVRAYLGALLTLAIEAPGGAGRAPQFVTALSHCRPLRPSRAFYDSVEQLPPWRDWMKVHSLPIFSRWGLWHDDMTLKIGSVYPLETILKVPELRARALCGPSIEAGCLSHTLHRATNARMLSKELNATYAATHAAVMRLVGRGLLRRERAGVRQELHLSPLSRAMLGIAD